jgi:hypothetical protein
MKLGPNPKELTEYLGSLVPAAVLTWALAVLTASYVGIATKIDAAFISSLVTSVLAVYGISKKDTDKKGTTIKKVVPTEGKGNDPQTEPKFTAPAIPSPEKRNEGQDKG